MSEKALGHIYMSTLDIVNNLGALYGEPGRLKETEGMIGIVGWSAGQGRRKEDNP